MIDHAGMGALRRAALVMNLFLITQAAPGLAESTLVPKPLAGDVALMNPLSGMYAGVAINPNTQRFRYPDPRFAGIAPSSRPLKEIYGRISWRQLEPEEGRYDFSALDAVLTPCAEVGAREPCLAPGGRFAFRVMAFDPQTAVNASHAAGDDGFPVYSDAPGYLLDGRHGWLLPVNASDPSRGRYFTPDWNDPVFLARAEALLKALAAKYDGDRRIAWIDIGIYGSWGEWHTAGLPEFDPSDRKIPYSERSPHFALNAQAYQANFGHPGAYQEATAASKARIVEAYLTAFPRTRLVMMTDDGEGLCHALSAPRAGPPVGLRRDSLGSGAWTARFPESLPGCRSAPDRRLILERWRTAPFLAEPFGNGSSRNFACRTFERDPATQAYLIPEQVAASHIAAIKHGWICATPWPQMAEDEQRAFLSAVARAGYRLAPRRVSVSETAGPAGGPRALMITTDWTNAGAAPPYDDWKVEFSLWPADDGGDSSRIVARAISAVDLRRILPTTSAPVAATDALPWPATAGSGKYRLKIRVFDPSGYLQPMRLALADQDDAGYAVLGDVELSPPP